VEGLLAETVPSGLKTEVLRQTSLQGLNVDTAEQEKACGIKLRQSYKCKSKWSLVMQSRYAYARQM
jgi:hypothetical protein